MVQPRKSEQIRKLFVNTRDKGGNDINGLKS